MSYIANVDIDDFVCVKTLGKLTEKKRIEGIILNHLADGKWWIDFGKYNKRKLSTSSFTVVFLGPYSHGNSLLQRSVMVRRSNR